MIYLFICVICIIFALIMRHDEKEKTEQKEYRERQIRKNEIEKMEQKAIESIYGREDKFIDQEAENRKALFIFRKYNKNINITKDGYVFINPRNMSIKDRKKCIKHGFHIIFYNEKFLWSNRRDNINTECYGVWFELYDANLNKISNERDCYPPGC